jgi:penicillin-binding protein 1A
MTLATCYGVYRVIRLTGAVASELDNATALAELTPRPQSTIVYDRYGHEAFTFFIEQRIDVSLDDISPRMLDAIVAIEDRRFYDHHGLDPARIAASAWKNLRRRKIVEGGSTITQQLARAAQQLTSRRTYERKIREAMIASRLEQRYSKREILEAYLNTVYFGDGYYGVEAASRGYFGKPAAALEAHEAALLAAIVRSPSRDAPGVSPSRSKARRDLVLRLMRDQHRLTDADYRVATAAALPERSRDRTNHVGVAAAAGDVGLYFQEELRRQLVAQFGSERLLRGGLRVYSTYDPRLQQLAETSIASRISQLSSSRAKVRDLQGSLVSMDPATGDVLALVGGRDFRQSSFNRATQARRQAGSAFKPMLFAAALERGFAPGTMLRGLDAPIMTSGGEVWLPAGEHERAEYTLRRALKLSSNRAAAQLMQQIGVSTTAYYAQRLGIQSPLPMVPSLALGTGDVTLLELTTAYSAFANRGIASLPRLFTRVEDAQGTTLHFQQERHAQAVSETTAYLMSSMLADVISSGTATRARSTGFKLPAAGKTGTTDDYSDAWFIGYTPHLLTGVWFGLDQPAPIMAEGFAGTVAVPAWTSFMKEATAGAKPDWYAMPADVEKVAICPLSGARATEACRHQFQYMTADIPVATGGVLDANGMPLVPALPVQTPRADVYEDLFPVGTVPMDPCPLHNPDGAGGNLGTSGTSLSSSGMTSSSATPNVDAALQQIRSTDARVYTERVIGPDGIVRFVMRQRQTPR